MSTPVVTLAPVSGASVANGAGQTHRVFRYYSIASLIGVVLAALAIGVFFRAIAIREIEHFGEYSNTTLAEMSLQALREDALKFLAQSNRVKKEELVTLGAVPVDLEHELAELRDVKSVVRVRIYNKNGWVIYSSEPGKLPVNEPMDEGVRVALAGQPVSVLNYYDSFSFFEDKGTHDNLIRTYLPVSNGPGQTARGVFEIFVDVKDRVADVEKAQWLVVVAALVVMGALYLSLLAFVRRAERVIERQQEQIQMHVHTLEVLSSRMLVQQEDEKKRIAFELHEGIAQTLSAIKMHVDATCRQLTSGVATGGTALEPMAQAIKDAIADVRGLALQLRPSSLDDLGLSATLRWYCREQMGRHPDLQIQVQISLSDEQVPQPLRVILFRVLEETLSGFIERDAQMKIQVSLDLEEEAIELQLSHELAALGTKLQLDDPLLSGAREKTLLSGGSFEVLEYHQGGRCVRATWLA